MDFSKLKEEDRIRYVGNSWAYEGSYKVIAAESTYAKLDEVPEDEKGKLMIVHITNSDMVLFITLDKLNPSEWELVERKDI